MNLNKAAKPKMEMLDETVRAFSVLLLACAVLSPLRVSAQQGGWTSIGPRPAGVGARIVADPRTGTVFIGSYGGGIRKSTDNGRTWTAANRGLTSMVVTSLAMDASG